MIYVYFISQCFAPTPQTTAARRTCKDKKKDCSVHVHVSLPCTGGSPLLNFCTNQVREQHTADFKELLGCLDEYFDACWITKRLFHVVRLDFVQ